MYRHEEQRTICDRVTERNASCSGDAQIGHVWLDDMGNGFHQGMTLHYRNNNRLFAYE